VAWTTVITTKMCNGYPQSLICGLDHSHLPSRSLRVVCY